MLDKKVYYAKVVAGYCVILSYYFQFVSVI